MKSERINMIKVNRDKPANDLKNFRKSSKAAPGNQQARAGTFDSLIRSESAVHTNSSIQGTQATLHELFDRYENAEQKFLQNNSIHNFKIYKEHLQKLLKHIQKESVTKHSWQDRRKKKFHVIKVLNNTLYQLGIQILNNQAGYKSVIDAVGEIRGLLIELNA